MAAEVTLGWNNDKLFAGSKQAEAIVQRSSQQMEKSLNKASGGGAFRGIGQVSLQLQDVAVQLQGGAKATTVIAQQVPQMLGAFGAGGAIVGGLVAVGAGLYGMADAAIESFRAASTASKGFETSLTRLLVSASPLELSDQFNTFKKTVEETQAALDKGVTFGQVLSQFNPAAPSIDEQLTQQRRTQLDAIQGMESIEARLVQLGQQNLNITSLRANGKADEADELQRQIELTAKLFQIQQSQFSAETKAMLSNQATAASTAAARAAATSKAFAETQKLIDAQNKLEDLKRTAALGEMDTAQRIGALHADLNRLIQEEAALRADFVPDGLALIENESKRVTLQQQILSLQKQLAGEKEREANAAKQAAEQVKRQAEEAARANERRREAVLNAQEEYDMLKARGTSRTSDDQQVERRSAIRRRRDQFMRENGLSSDEATARATEMQNMEERASGRGRIRHTGVHKTSAGLSAFYADQRTPSAFDRLQSGESAFDRLQRTPSAFQRLQQQAAQDRVAGPVMPAPAANTPPPAADPRPVVQAIQSLPEEIARRLLEN